MLKTIVFLLITLLLVPLSVIYFDVPLTLLQKTTLQSLLVAWTIAAGWCFISGEVTGNVSQVDKLWSIMPQIYAWIMAWYGGWHLRFVVMAALVTIWGIRLTYNFSRRGGYSLIPWQGEEDYRWGILRSKPPLNARLAWTLFHLLFITLYQHTLILLFCMPMLVALENPAGPMMWYEWMPALAMLAFVVVETVADQQQYDFQTEKYKRLQAGTDAEAWSHGFVRTGLWALCRHPNYAAEQMVWICFYLCSVAATGRLVNWSVAGCILLMLLFLGSSDFSEKISASKYPEYASYQARTPRFWPRFIHSKSN